MDTPLATFPLGMAERSATRRREDLLRAWHYYENALRALDEPGSLDVVRAGSSRRLLGLRHCPEGSLEPELRAWVVGRLRDAQRRVEDEMARADDCGEG